LTNEILRGRRRGLSQRISSEYELGSSKENSYPDPGIHPSIVSVTACPSLPFFIVSYLWALLFSRMLLSSSWLVSQVFHR